MPSTAPFFLLFALHGRCICVLHFEPIGRAAANVRRAQTLRHDPLAAELAGVAVDDVTAVIEVLDEPQPRPAGAQQARQRRLAPVMKRSSKDDMRARRDADGRGIDRHPDVSGRLSRA